MEERKITKFEHQGNDVVFSFNDGKSVIFKDFFETVDYFGSYKSCVSSLQTLTSHPKISNTHPMVDVRLSVDKTSGSIPEYATVLSSGMDLQAATHQKIAIPAGKSALIPTGLKMAIPPGYELQVRPKSGLALKHSITVLNSPGTIDGDYRGEIGVILINHGQDAFIVTPAMKIAQGVLCPVYRANLIEVISDGDLGYTERKGGFGSTGC
jgi:dUTP pyrophosphatase